MAVKFFADFDGVFNVSASKSQLNKNRDKLVLGHIRRVSIPIDGKFYPIVYSSELVVKLKAILDDRAVWVWNTSWDSHSSKLNDLFVLSAPHVALDVDNVPDSSSLERNLWESIVSKRKFDRMLAMLTPNEPFIWVDDVATDHNDLTRAADHPHLIIKTSERFGLGPDHLLAIDRFLGDPTGNTFIG